MHYVNFIEPSLCVISIIGGHASEEMDGILARKSSDIQKTGFTLWVFKSNLFTFNDSLNFSKTYTQDLPIYFVSPSTNRHDNNTQIVHIANTYSDGVAEFSIPKDLSPVTGSLGNKGATAFVLKSLNISNDHINLNDFSNYFNLGIPLKFYPGRSTVLAAPENMNKHQQKVKSSVRRIVAEGRLTHPYSVLVKT